MIRSFPISILRRAVAGGFSVLCACTLCTWEADGLAVRFGHFDMAQPFKVACARGWFDKVLSNGEMMEVYCMPQSSGGYGTKKKLGTRDTRPLRPPRPLLHAAAAAIATAANSSDRAPTTLHHCQYGCCRPGSCPRNDIAVSKLDDGDLDLAILGSTPWATSVSRGVDADTVMIEYLYESNEVRAVE